MRNKLRVGVVLLLAFAILFSFSFVSAKSTADKINKFGDDVFSVIEPAAGLLLGETSNASVLFAKVLLLFMMFGIVWEVVGSVDFFSNKYLLGIISVAVSILSIRWLTKGLVNTIILPYSVLGVVFSIGIPFLIWFMLVNVGLKDSSSIVRKTAWIFFAVIFVGLWIARYSELEGIIWIYPVAAIAALIMAWLDGTIQRFFRSISISKKLRIFDDEEYMRRKKENKEFYEDYVDLVATGDEGDYKKAKAIWKKIQANEEQMARLEAGTPDRSGPGKYVWRMMGGNR